MDYEALRAGMGAAVPFNNHIGLEITELGPGVAVVRLPGSEPLRNRVSFPVEVELTNADGETVATATIQWHVRKNG